MTNDLSEIKMQIKVLCEKKQTIHVDMSLRNKNKNLSDLKGEITGVYPNVFTIDVFESEHKKSYNFQYTDLLINNIKIAEIN